jgi:hypothetical protein
VIDQTYVTGGGRKRPRVVRVDLGEVRRGLGVPTPDDGTRWQQARALLLDAIDESTYAIWLEPIELIAVDDSCSLPVTRPLRG